MFGMGTMKGRIVGHLKPLWMKEAEFSVFLYIAVMRESVKDVNDCMLTTLVRYQEKRPGNVSFPWPWVLADVRASSHPLCLSGDLRGSQREEQH